ncbi:sugar porter family MFS transporter [Asticcacaulis sp. 201]|uniref:sugar porter family MFS transporter n=1 Tax=Asticcacaulis sp. 201 TaxID=3028787 RepID=UPI0029168FA8|nr:sugar porter family MFS transporter [Asticcacaulis sp. 201]MDV6330694.1 sugar porter family MFS transporter [Asticcacaulis sp. 201]
MPNIIEPDMGDPAEAIAGDGGNLVFVTLVCLVSAIGGFLFGYETVVIAGALSLVTAEFHFSAVMEGWFVTSGLFGCAGGVLLAGRLCDAIGRKKVMLLSAFLLGLCAVVCCVAATATWLIAGRIIGGLGVGIASVVSPLYISELAPPKVRGRLVSLFQLTITLGIVSAMITNAGVLDFAQGAGGAALTGLWHWLVVQETWRAMFLTQLVPSVVFFLLALCVPESPRWLSLAGKQEKARAVLLRLRGNADIADAELTQIARSGTKVKGEAISWWSAAIRRPLFLGIFLAVFSELSGITLVMYYGPVILEKAGISVGSSLGGHAVIGIVLACFTVISLFVVDRFGRRPVLLTGVAGACIALAATALCFAYGVSDGALIITLLCLFVAFFAFSIGPIKWIVISEIFPTRVRAPAMGVATVAVWLTDMAINQAFPVVRDTLGVSAMFLACAAFLAIQFWVVLSKLPETKGLPLEDILSLWSNQNMKRVK